MGADSFIRRASGLLVPRMSFAAPWRFLPCEDCCVSTCATCTCSACSDSPFPAPCCWKVVIAGIVDGSCSDCDALNKTYYLSQDTPAGCTWSEGAVCGDCDPTDITLVVSLDGSDYIITVTMGGHVWKKNYGTSKPECCGLGDETIAHLTNSGDCDSSSATCVITALGDGHPCETAGCFEGDCDSCTDFPQEWAADFGAGGWVNFNCDFCDQVVGVFVLEGGVSGGFCSAAYQPGVVCSWPTSNEANFVIGLDIELVSGSDYRYSLEVSIRHFGAGELIVAIYKSTTWDGSAPLPSCLSIVDVNGKIEMTKSSEFRVTGADNPCADPTFSPLPDPIFIWDANT